MKFLPTPKQIEAHQLLNDNRIVLYGGAIRGAKSYWGCMEIVSLCFKYPNSRWIMVRQTRPRLTSTLLVTFNENFLDKGLSQYVESFNNSSLVLTWNNGSQILFMAEGYDTDKDLNKFKGLEFNGGFIDEINEIQEQTFDKIIERSGSWFGSAGCPTKILASCNPTNNWVKKRFYEPWKLNTLPDGIAYLQAKITDNPHVPAEYLESLKMLPRYQYMVFVEGNWDVQVKVGGEFYKCFEMDKHIVEVQYDPELPLHISWDENVNPYLPCGIFQIKGKEIRMIDEIAGINPRNTIKAVCNEFKRKYPTHRNGLFIYGDATANKEDVKQQKGHNFYHLIMQELEEYKPRNRVQSSNPSVPMRGNWINTILENEIDDIVVKLDPQCKFTINDFIYVKESADGTKTKDFETDSISKVRYQKYGHFTDLFDYFICTAFANDFVKYQYGNKTLQMSMGKNKAKHGY